MSPRPILLKFGSSILRAEDRIPIAVGEIYRWVRLGRPVIVVVSAFRGRTDELVAEAGQLGLAANSHHRASWLARGEAEAVNALTEALALVGVGATAVGPGELGLVAEGGPGDSTPVRVNTATIDAVLNRGEVAVVPGFVGVDGNGRPVTLGRGGSDLSAIAIGHALNSDIRLIKDPAGVYEWDPSEGGPAPRRFESLRYSDALALSDRVIQPKAIEFARRIGVPFDFAGINRDDGTRVGANTTAFGEDAAAAPIRIGVLGLGTVGGGLVSRLALHPERFEIVGALVRRPGVERKGVSDGIAVVSDPEALFAAAPEVIVELIGGTEDADTLVRRALSRGIDVVTANKALIATRGAELRSLAWAHGARLLVSASVGGGVPVLERLREASDRAAIESIRAVLNGTTNFVLNGLRTGLSYDAAINAAREAGFAEADPSLDLNGIDTAQKLAVIAAEVFGLSLDPASIACEPLRREDASSIGRSADAIRQVGVLEIRRGRAFGRVGLVPVRAGPLAGLDGPGNAVEIAFTDGRREVIVGLGAGRIPTAESVLADLLEIERERRGRPASGHDRRGLLRHSGHGLTQVARDQDAIDAAD